MKRERLRTILEDGLLTAHEADLDAPARKGVMPWAVDPVLHGLDVTFDGLEEDRSGISRQTAEMTPWPDQGRRARFVVLETSAARPPPSATIARPDPASTQWRAASLFCGLGGLDLGFAGEGFHTAEAYDKDQGAVSTYNINLPSVAQLADLSIGHCPAGLADILLAGAPCQGFSTVGKRDVDDPRNYLLSRVGHAASAIQPRVIVVENVPAAASGPHGRHLRLLEESLKWSGFNVRRVRIDGESTGLAQRRQRLFLICWRGSEHRRVEISEVPSVRLASAFAMVTGLDGHDPRPLTDPNKLAIAMRIAGGQKLSNVRIGSRNIASWEVPEVYGATTEEERRLLVLVARLRRRSRVRDHGDGDPITRETLDSVFGRDASSEIARLIEAGYLRDRNDLVDLRHTYNGKYRRLHWDMPSPTVDTHFGNASNFLHPTEHRGMTLREAMRLQGLPDWYTLTGSKQGSFRMVGNAVPPPMAGAVARFVRDALLKDCA